MARTGSTRKRADYAYSAFSFCCTFGNIAERLRRPTICVGCALLPLHGGDHQQRDGRHRQEKRGQTRASVVFGAHLASAVSLLFLLFDGRREGGVDVDVGFWLAPQASEFKAFRRGPPRTALAWLPLPPSISPLFDATTIAHNAPNPGDAVEVRYFPFWKC